MTRYFFYNDRLINVNEPVFNASNRGFRFGDTVFETIRVFKGRIPFINEHYNRLKEALECLQYDIPENFGPAFFMKKIVELCAKNEDDGNARVRLTLFRKNSKTLDVKNFEPDYTIQSSHLITEEFNLNNEGLIVDCYTENRKDFNVFSKFKTGNYLVSVLANIHATENGLDDCLLLNRNDEVIEATTSNIFMVQNNVLITPPVTSGCVDGILRRQILEICNKLGIKIQQIPITDIMLKKAEEVFLTNSIAGIRWVKKYGNKEYFSNATANLILKELNQIVN